MTPVDIRIHALSIAHAVLGNDASIPAILSAAAALEAFIAGGDEGQAPLAPRKAATKAAAKASSAPLAPPEVDTLPPAPPETHRAITTAPENREETPVTIAADYDVDIKPRIVRLVQQSKREQAVAILAKFSAKSGHDLKPAHYPEVLALLKEALGE